MKARDSRLCCLASVTTTEVGATTGVGAGAIGAGSVTSGVRAGSSSVMIVAVMVEVLVAVASSETTMIS